MNHDEAHAVVEALLRLDAALADMREELPGQLALAADPASDDAAVDHALAAQEKQLRWLADDMARVRATFTARGNSHDGKH